MYDLIFKDRTRWSVGIWHGLCIASTNTALVEESIVQLKGASNFTDDKTVNNFKFKVRIAGHWRVVFTIGANVYRFILCPIENTKLSPEY